MGTASFPSSRGQSAQPPDMQTPLEEDPSGCRPPCKQEPPPPMLVMWPVMRAGKPPPWTEWQTRVKTLPCTKLRLREVKIVNLMPLYNRNDDDINNKKCQMRS